MKKPTRKIQTPAQPIRTVKQVRQSPRKPVSLPSSNHENPHYILLKKETYDLLIDSEKRYRALLENCTDSVSILDRAGTPVYVSPWREKILGYTAAEAMNLDRRSLIHPDDLERTTAFQKAAQNRIAMVTPESFTIRMKHKDGTWRYMEGTITDMQEVPFINGFVGNFRDVTERLMTEKNIVAEKELSDSIINSLPGIFYLYNKKSKILRWNKNFEKISGYNREEIRQMLPTDFFAAPGQSFGNGKSSQVPEGHSGGIDISLKTRHGETIPFHINSIDTSYQGNECVMVTGIDISARKQAEEENRKLAMIANLTINAVVLTDHGGNIRWINHAFEQLTGFSLAELLDLNFSDFLNKPGVVLSTVTLVRSCFLQKKGCKIEFLNFHRSGREYWVDIEIVPMRNAQEDITGFMVLGRDITDRRVAQYELLELNRDLQRQAAELLASNEELEQFAYVASHDLQEPLRMVSGFMQLLKKNYEPLLDEKAKEYVRYAVDGADRMRCLIMHLLEYSRVGTNKAVFEATDMNLVIREVVALFNKNGSEPGFRLMIQEMPKVHANRSQMVQLIQNLVGNAIKYKTKKLPVIRINVKEEIEHFLFSISDNGIGIEPHYFKKIFVLFQRLHTKEEYSGTGIGLAICKKIVELHGGSIWVESRVGKGSTFFFTISK